MAGIIDRIKAMFGGTPSGDEGSDGEINVHEDELDSDASYDRVRADVERTRTDAFNRLSDMDDSRNRR